MRGSNDQSPEKRARDVAVWKLVKKPHGVIARRQLLEHGFSARWIERRIASGRLHPLWRGVYAVGRPTVDRRGGWMAAALAVGPGAALSHGSAAELWGFGRERRGAIEVSMPVRRRSRMPRMRIHRRSASVMSAVVAYENIPLTSPLRTLIDEATYLRPMQLERAVNEAAGCGPCASLTGKSGTTPHTSARSSAAPSPAPREARNPG